MKQRCIFSEISSLNGSELKAEIDEIVWTLSRGSQLVPLKFEEMAYLYEELVIEKRRFYSFSGGNSRMNSIVQEVRRWEPYDKDTFCHILILIQTSKEHPLTISELQLLNVVNEGLSPKVEIQWGVGVNDDLGDKLFLMVVYSKQRLP